MSTELWVVDAFTSEPFHGNPAAVCILPSFLSDAAMQRIAMEMNLPETAFLVKQAARDYALRWFTPTTEVNLCGHATLAATHRLRESGTLRDGEAVTYHTLSGELRAHVDKDSITLDFPALPGQVSAPHPALSALGIEFLACERNRDNYLVEVSDNKTLLACSPDFRTLAGIDLQGVIVTTASGLEDFDFASRYFGPGCGIDEDPVTGSAHCFLAPYWAKKLKKKRFYAVQESKRGGVLDVTLEGERVRISGKAVTTLKGGLQIPMNYIQEHAA